MFANYQVNDAALLYALKPLPALVPMEPLGSVLPTELGNTTTEARGDPIEPRLLHAEDDVVGGSGGVWISMSLSGLRGMLGNKKFRVPPSNLGRLDQWQQLEGQDRTLEVTLPVSKFVFEIVQDFFTRDAEFAAVTSCNYGPERQAVIAANGAACAVKKKCNSTLAPSFCLARFMPSADAPERGVMAPVCNMRSERYDSWFMEMVADVGELTDSHDQPLVDGRVLAQLFQVARQIDSSLLRLFVRQLFGWCLRDTVSRLSVGGAQPVGQRLGLPAQGGTDIGQLIREPANGQTWYQALRNEVNPTGWYYALRNMVPFAGVRASGLVGLLVDQLGQEDLQEVLGIEMTDWDSELEMVPLLNINAAFSAMLLRYARGWTSEAHHAFAGAIGLHSQHHVQLPVIESICFDGFANGDWQATQTLLRSSHLRRILPHIRRLVFRNVDIYDIATVLSDVAAHPNAPLDTLEIEYSAGCKGVTERRDAAPSTSAARRLPKLCRFAFRNNNHELENVVVSAVIRIVRNVQYATGGGLVDFGWENNAPSTEKVGKDLRKALSHFFVSPVGDDLLGATHPNYPQPRLFSELDDSHLIHPSSARRTAGCMQFMNITAAPAVIVHLLPLVGRFPLNNVMIKTCHYYTTVADDYLRDIRSTPTWFVSRFMRRLLLTSPSWHFLARALRTIDASGAPPVPNVEFSVMYPAKKLHQRDFTSSGNDQRKLAAETVYNLKQHHFPSITFESYDTF